MRSRLAACCLGLLACGTREQAPGVTSETAPVSTDARSADAGAAPVARTLVPAQLVDCTNDRWCRLPGLVPDDAFHAWAAAGGDSFWAAGNNGLVVHWDGTRFAHWRIGNGSHKAVGTDGSDTWVSDGSRGVRYRDGAWKPFVFGARISGIDAVSVRDRQAWFVAWGAREAPSRTVGPLLIHVAADDTVTARAMPVQASHVWARTADDVWIVGSLGKGIWRWNGTRWLDTRLPKRKVDSDYPSRIAGSAADDVWAIAAGDTWQWNGRAWKVVAGAPYGRTLQVRAKDDVLIGNTHSCERWDGTRWTSMKGRGLLLASGRILVETDQMTIRENAAAGGTVLPRGTGIAADDLWVGDHELLVVGKEPDGDRGMLARWDGARWTRERLAAPRVLAADGRATPWLVHVDGSVSHQTKTGWVVETTGLTRASDIVVISDDDVWIAGDEQLAHRQGGAWTVVQAPAAESLRSIAATPAGALFAVARPTYDQARLFRWDGAKFVDIAPFDASATRLAALGERELVTATNNLTLRWTGAPAPAELARYSFVMALRRIGTQVVLVARPQSTARDTADVMWVATLPAPGEPAWEGLPIYASAVAGHAGQLWVMSEPSGDLAVRAR